MALEINLGALNYGSHCTWSDLIRLCAHICICAVTNKRSYSYGKPDIMKV